MFAGVPARPGVYYLFGRDDRLLYVGQAVDLRRRLGAHVRSAPWRQVGAVRFETTASTQAALAREADILAALRPPWNKAHVDDYFSFIIVSADGLSLAKEGEFGCFPHLGKGALSESGRACIDGFDALGRIVKATHPEEKLVRRFLAGTSDRLLRGEIDIDQPHIRYGVERDRRLASRFYQAGPKAMRDLRVRHGGRRPVSRAQFTAWIAQEVQIITSAEPAWATHVATRLPQ